jgi:pimeloyl-ACP methyl ester carboxylesterase
MLFINLLMTFSFAQLPSLDCSTSSEKGFVEVPLFSQFTELQTKAIPKRIPVILEKLKGSESTQKFHLYYEFAKPYDPQKETIFVSGGFFPWVNLNIVKNNFPYLTQNFNLFQIHYRGSGCSATPAGINPLYFSHEFVARDIEFVRNKFGIKKLHSWASSNGAWVALTYALLFPQNADRFLLRDTAIREPGLIEASQNFEQFLMPQLLSDSSKQELYRIAQAYPEVYRSLLRIFGTALMRREEQRIEIPNFLSLQHELLFTNQMDPLLLKNELDSYIQKIESWSEVTTANECVGGEYDKLLDYEKISVVAYVYERCQAFKAQYQNVLIPDLDFSGLLSGLKNSFFIYQGYWDDYLYFQLAEELSMQLPNSQIFVDKQAGHGEISKKTYPCFEAITRAFFGGPSSKDLTNLISKSCVQ